MRVEDVFTYIKNPGDTPFLTTEFLDVNIRLFHSNPFYRGIIGQINGALKALALENLEGYGLPYGISGANIAVPLNIIGIVHNRGTKHAFVEIMMNPRIFAWSAKTEVARSNCGSLRLPEPIPVRRYSTVAVEFFDEEGHHKTKYSLDRAHTGFTLQHEVDHNRGILITEREAVP